MFFGCFVAGWCFVMLVVNIIFMYGKLNYIFVDFFKKNLQARALWDPEDQWLCCDGEWFFCVAKAMFHCLSVSSFISFCAHTHQYDVHIHAL